MIRPLRVPRPRRPVILTIMVTALLALPMGIVLANHQFSDVPNGNDFHADIDALVDAGITAGCGGGKYCPSANVTREQMAAFMNRLGALAPGKAPVVNADKVDGLDATGFHRYNATAPVGASQLGMFGVSGHAAAAGQYDAGYSAFPVPLAAEVSPHVMAPGDVMPAGCSGSSDAPAASPGHLCIFVDYELNSSGSYAVYGHDGIPGTSRFGFSLALASTGTGNYAVIGTYAVTGGAGVASVGEDSEPMGPRSGE